MQTTTLWQAKTYAYQATVTITYEDGDSGDSNATGDFDILPGQTITMGDTFTLHPHDITVKSSCTFQSIRFIIERDGKTYTGSNIISKTTDDVYTAAKYPTVIQAGATHFVSMVIKTSCGEDTVGPKELNVVSPGGSTTPPEGDNKPPYAEIAWVDPSTNEPAYQVKVGDILNLRTLKMTDPDGDEVHLVSWDFSRSTEWLANLPVTRPIIGLAPGYDGITMAEEGIQTVYLIVEDSKGAQYDASASVAVVSPNPVAVITGTSRVKAGRSLPLPIDGSKSYSPIGLPLTDYVWTNKADKYDDPGDVTITLKVQDSEGRWSQLATHDLTVIPDEPPVALLSVPTEETRLGTVHIESASYSPDGDTIVSHVIERKYDAANDGFSNDSWTTVQSGATGTYDFTPARVGKYLFRETVCEDYGKCASSDDQPEVQRTVNVLNLAPTIDVSTSSNQTGAPDRRSVSMTDLYNSGTIVNVDNGGAGNKNNWLLNNGYLTTKTYFSDVGSFSLLRDITFEAQAGPGHVGGSLPDRGLFASIQNPPTLTNTAIQMNSYWGTDMVSDEKYTYVSDIGKITAYNNATMTPVWTQTYPYNQTLNYNFNMMVQGNYLVLNYGVTTWYSDKVIYDTYLATIDKNTGALLAGPLRVYSTPNWGMVNATVDKNGIILYGTPDAAAARYGFDLTRQYSYSSLLSNAGASDVMLAASTGNTFFSTWYRYSNGTVNIGAGGDFVYDQSGVGLYHLDNATAGGFFNQLIGEDADHNVYATVGYGGNYHDIIKMSPTGTILQKTHRAAEWDFQKAYPLGLDPFNNIVFETATGGGCTGACSNMSDRQITAVDINGNTKYQIDTWPSMDTANYKGNLSQMIVGSDGLVNLFGLYWYKPTKEVYMKLVVYDPSNGAIIRNDLFDTGTTNYTGSPGYYLKVFPAGDQSFTLKVTNASGGYTVYKLSAAGALSYPRQFELGPASRDLWIGGAMQAGDTLSGDIVPSKPSNAGAGYLFRLQDKNNYYSVEFENGLLVAKKTVSGTAAVLQSKSFALVKSSRYSIQLVPTASGFSVLVNRIKQFDVADTTWTTGKFGIINRGQEGVQYGNVTTQASGAVTGTISGVVLVGEPLDYSVTFDDPEHDPRLTSAESWDYVHNPNVFLLPQGLWNGSGTGHTATPVTTFDKPGEYTFKFKTKDDPNPDKPYPNAAFDSYRQFSNEVTGAIRVHRRPVADFSVSINADHWLTFVDRSYDPDRYDPATGAYSTEATGINYAANHGILEWRWRYRLDTSSAYNETQPTRLFGGTYVIELAVMDEYGAWSDWATQTITADGTSPLPPTPGFTISPNPAYRFSPVTIDSTASDPQSGGRESLEHAYYIKNLTTGGQETLQSDARTSWDKMFSSLGLFNVRQVVTNGYGLYAEANHTVTVANRKPAVNINVPASSNSSNPTLVTTLRPEIVWSYSDPDGDPQMQWQVQIYKYDNSLRADTGIRSGSNLTWTPTADLEDGTSYIVQARVFDGYDWSDWSAWKYFRTETNKPPTADFDWSPSLIYEGDTVTFAARVDDPDRDALSLSYAIESPSGARRTIAETKSYPYSAAGPSATTIELGVWTATLTVSDGKAPPVAVSKTFRVWPLGISGQVRHTEAWEANRLRYNEQHPGAERPANWFWAGEAFVLEAAVTDTGGSATKASLVIADAGSGLRKTLTAADAPAFRLWQGTLGSADAGFPLDTLPEGDYLFTFTVTYTNGVVKTAQAAIHVEDTVDDYVQVHRLQ